MGIQRLTRDDYRWLIGGFWGHLLAYVIFVVVAVVGLAQYSNRQDDKVARNTAATCLIVSNEVKITEAVVLNSRAIEEIERTVPTDVAPASVASLEAIINELETLDKKC
jgi:hypothetical protein